MKRPVLWGAHWGIAGLLGVLFGLAGCAEVGEGDVDLVLRGLSQCSPAGQLQEVTHARITVTGPDLCRAVDGSAAECPTTTGKWGQTLSIGGILAGTEREVTVLAYAGDPARTAPIGYARATGVTIVQGERASVAAMLSRLGMANCATLADPFAARAFASATLLGRRYVFVAGGFTGFGEADGDTRLLAEDDNSRAIFVYDTLSGGARQVGTLSHGRGAHTAVYLPQRKAVVVFGGARALPFATGQEFPIRFAKDDLDLSFDDFEMFDVSRVVDAERLGDVVVTRVAPECPSTPCLACCASDGTPLPGADPNCVQAQIDCGACCFECGSGQRMVRGRIFAQAAVMSDEFVIITGGGDFPASAVADYRISDVFDAAANCGGGGFQNRPVLPRTESIRAGHTMTFVETNVAGRYRFLLWGGVRDGGGPLAETYLESSLQADAIPGVFREVEIENPELARRLYFHTVTQMGERQFLLAGGVRPGGGRFAAPDAADAYVLTLSGEDVIRVRIDDAVQVMPTGRFLHSATTHDGRYVSLLGGARGFGGLEGDFAAAVTLDARTRGFAATSDTPPRVRLGQAVALLPDHTLLLVGGTMDGTDLSGAAGALEIFTPSFLGQ